MSKILVCGSNGQLGNCLREVSTNSENHFVFYSKEDLNLLETKVIQGVFEKEKPQFIINCAAYTKVDDAEKDQEQAFLVNEVGTRNLSEVSNSFNAILIHISTDYVFDGKNSRPYHELDLTNPVSVYGKSKLKGEQEILNKNKNAYIIRTAWLYSHFGKNFLKTIYKLAIDRPKIDVVGDQVGTPTFSIDLALAICSLINKIDENRDIYHKPGVYHFSNEGVCSWYDFAKAIIEFGHLECDVNPINTDQFPTPAKRPSYSVLDKNKVKSNFEIKIPYWRDSVKKCVNLLKELE